jgi:hypothetical protein
MSENAYIIKLDWCKILHAAVSSFISLQSAAAGRSTQSPVVFDINVPQLRVDVVGCGQAFKVRHRFVCNGTAS